MPNNNKKERPWLNRLGWSLIVGHTTSTSTKLWFRLKRKGRYHAANSSSSLTGKLTVTSVAVDGKWTVNDFNLTYYPLILLVVLSKVSFYFV